MSTSDIPVDAAGARRFNYGQPVELEETSTVEFKEVIGKSPVNAITNAADEYAVAFLNAAGGSILWGIRDSDRVVVGVTLPATMRDEVRRSVVNKLGGIQPHVDPSLFQITFYPVVGEDAQKDLFVVELTVPRIEATDPYFTEGNGAFVRLEGAKRKINGPQLTAWIKRRLIASTLASSADDPSVVDLLRRVRRIFEGHGVEVGHMRRFLKAAKAPFDIDFADLQSDRSFLNWLDDAKIDWIAKTFLIRREWIDGENEQIYDCYSFDKQPKRFYEVVGGHVDNLRWSDVPWHAEGYFIRWGKGKEWRTNGKSGVFFVLAVPLARLSNERIVWKYVSDFDDYPADYGRTYVQLLAWARLLTVEMGIACRGYEISYEDGLDIAENRAFLYELFEKRGALTRIKWHPDDHALYPSESMGAKSENELPHVIEFLRSNGLPWKERPGWLEARLTRSKLEE